MLDATEDLRRGHLQYFPVVPGSLEFAVEVRRALLDQRPEVVAIELPHWLHAYYRRAVARLPEFSVLLFPDAGLPGRSEEEDSGVYVVVEPADPFIEAFRTATEIGADILLIEPDAIDRPHLPAIYPDPFTLSRISRKTYIERYRLSGPPRSSETEEQASAMAWRLQGADPGRSTFVVLSLNLLDPVLDAYETPQPAPRPRLHRDCEILNPHPNCLAEITLEAPFLQERYENWRATPGEPWPGRLRLQWELVREAGAAYEAQTGDKLYPWHRRLLARYARNLALIDSQWLPGLFDLTVAARNIVDDNFAWELWNAANGYFWQRETVEPETIQLSGDEVFLRTRRMRLRRRLPRPKRMLAPRGLRKRPKEKRPGEWAEQVDGEFICSYPPEDIVIEDYGKLLRQRARSMLSEERVRIEPFTTSVLDGIDIRETIRNWHQNKIFVRKFDKRSGDVGAVIVIFDEDPLNRYSYMTTWLGEHQNESDMAFYSTPPFEHMVGPGIGRAEYGGFLMALPPRRMFDVWGDPDYDFAETKSERLLLAGLDYSVERHVVYVAAKPPRSIFRSIAAHLGRSILYIPIGQLSPARLKKIRVVHILDGHDKRDLAKDFLW
jgi:hypothetical protein